MWRRILWWLHRNSEQRDLDEEIRSHIALETRERLEAGDDPGHAPWAARRAFGNPTRIAEDTRDVWRLAWLDDLWQDVRYGLRKLGQSPGFTIAAILTLALGIGANTAIFRLLDAVRLRALPVENAEQLTIVDLVDRSKRGGRQATGYPALTNSLWEQFRDTQQVFSGVFAWASASMTYGRDAEPGAARSIRGLFVSGDFFRVLGVPPMLGRTFEAADDRRGCGTPGAVVSYGFWQSELGGDPSAVGRQILLNRQPVPVAGIAPEGFTGLEVGRSFDVAVPICSHEVLGAEEGWLDAGAQWWLITMGRRAPGQPLEAASAGLAAMSPALFASTVPGDTDQESRANYLALRLRASSASGGVSTLRERYDDPLIVLLGGAGLVLLLACANLANLILSRASLREREFAVRAALGASRRRLVRQLMVENGILAMGGAAVGVGVAVVLTRTLIGFLSTENNPTFLDLQIDLRLLAYIGAIAGGTCIAFGLLPAWNATREGANDSASEAIKGRGAGAGYSRKSFGLRQGLVVAQVALSLVLLFGALLFSGTLANLLAVDPGFDSEGVSVARVDYLQLKLPQDRKLAFKREVLEAIRAVPGVIAAETRHIPLGNTGSRNEFTSGENVSTPVAVLVNAISDGYLEAMGMALLAGRDFSPGDSSPAPKVALVNRRLAERFGWGDNPVGRILRKDTNDGIEVTEVVGMVENTKYSSLREDFFPIVFIPVEQNQDPRTFTDFMIRSSLPSGSVSTAIRSAVVGVNPLVNVAVTPLASNVDGLLLRERLMATLSGYFGVLAALIAAIGIYGVMASLVAGRTSEIGVRIALGAQRGDILRVIMGRTGALVGAGLAIGAGLALFAGRSAESLLFGLDPFSANLAALACVLLLVVAAAASYLPARRALRVDPVVALRKE